MRLHAWRTIGKNPCNDPPITITIAPVEKIPMIYPWVLPLERAIELLGQEVVGQIGVEPVVVEFKVLKPATNDSPGIIILDPKSSESHRSSET